MTLRTRVVLFVLFVLGLLALTVYDIRHADSSPCIGHLPCPEVRR